MVEVMAFFCDIMSKKKSAYDKENTTYTLYSGVDRASQSWEEE